MSYGARLGIAAVFVTALLSAAGCAESGRVPQVVSQTPMSLPRIAVNQTGNAAVIVDQGSVSFAVDAAGSLVVRVSVTSNAPRSQTIIIRASIFDPSGMPIGEATGGQVAVPPGRSTAVQLNGPTPHGTIASALFEVTGQPSPTTSS